MWDTFAAHCRVPAFGWEDQKERDAEPDFLDRATAEADQPKSWPAQLLHLDKRTLVIELQAEPSTEHDDGPKAAARCELKPQTKHQRECRSQATFEPHLKEWNQVDLSLVVVVVDWAAVVERWAEHLNGQAAGASSLYAERWRSAAAAGSSAAAAGSSRAAESSNGTARSNGTAHPNGTARSNGTAQYSERSTAGCATHSEVSVNDPLGAAWWAAAAVRPTLSSTLCPSEHVSLEHTI